MPKIFAIESASTMHGCAKVSVITDNVKEYTVAKDLADQFRCKLDLSANFTLYNGTYSYSFVFKEGNYKKALGTYLLYRLTLKPNEEP